MAPMVHIFECLVPSWWNCLRRIRRRGLAGGAESLGWVLRFQKPKPFPVSRFGLSPTCGSDVSSQADAPSLLPAALLPALLLGLQRPGFLVCVQSLNKDLFFNDLLPANGGAHQLLPSPCLNGDLIDLRRSYVGSSQREFIRAVVSSCGEDAAPL